MKKCLIILLVICIVAVSGCTEQKDNIIIGAILTMTGAGANIGEDVSNGLNLAIEEINSRGGINGRMIELIVEDCKTDADESIKIFNNMEANNSPHIYLTITSLISLAIAPLAEENSAPHVVLVSAADHDELIGNGEWVFRTFSTTEDEIPPLISIAEDKGLQSMGILYLDNGYGQAVSALMKEEFEKIGGTVMMDPMPAEGNFTEELSKYLELDVIYVIGFDPHIIKGFEKIRELDYNGTVFGPATTTLPGVRSIPEAEGVYAPAPLVYKQDFLFAQEVKSKYEAKYDKPFSHYAGQGYNFIKILEGLLEDQEDVSRATIQKVFEQDFSYGGVFGTLNTAGKRRHEMGFDLVSAQIINGEVNYLN